ncbi:hypothetical protein BDW62DRAFT_206850 [Aspergillus aurantiobrunneus]
MAANILETLIGSVPQNDLLHILHGVLNHLDYPDVLNYIDAFPARLLQVFAWGLQPTGHWPHHVRPTTHADVINWHANRMGVANIQLPLGPGVREHNLAGINFPIDFWIHNNRLDILRRLHIAGHWEPCGWSLNGSSYYEIACGRNTVNVREYIEQQAVGDVIFCTAEHRIPGIADNPGNAQGEPSTHLDLVLQQNLPGTFWRWWNSIQPQPNAQPILNRASRIALCQICTGDQALTFLNNNNINLATALPALSNYILPNMVPAHGAGTVWHLALANPNLSFMHFLNHQVPAQVNWHQGRTHTPLRQALENKQLAHFHALLQMPADPTDVARHMLRQVPFYRDPYFLIVKDSIHWPALVGDGTGAALHWIVEGLRGQLAAINANPAFSDREKRNTRRQKTNWAMRLVAFIKQGNVYGGPTLQERNRLGFTAPALARHYGFWDLEWALEGGRRR